MGPKKTNANLPDLNRLPDVDKEFYELKLEDLNRKLARLQNYCDQLEQQNEEMRNKLSKLDSDSADIISHLKRTLQNKKEEIIELNERITALEQAKQTEKNLFLEKINNMNLDFKRMHEHHTSEIKLLNGKLNSLEEFRTQREELMDKFEKQEADAAEQKEQHKNEVYELENSLIIAKDKLRKEMETKLLNLSLDFQRATQARIASTTQSVIKENIAINNELNVLISAWKELNIENDNMREELKRVRIEYGIDKREKDRAMERNLIQAQVVERLAYEHHKLFTKHTEFAQLEKRSEELERIIRNTEIERDDQIIRVKVLLEKIHMHKIDAIANKNARIQAEKHSQLLEKTIRRALKIVQELIGLQKSVVVGRVNGNADEEAMWCEKQRATRSSLMMQLVELLSNNELFTVPSLSDIVGSTTTLTESEWTEYALSLGDLGLIPRNDPKYPKGEQVIKQKKTICK